MDVDRSLTTSRCDSLRVGSDASFHALAPLIATDFAIAVTQNGLPSVIDAACVTNRGSGALPRIALNTSAMSFLVMGFNWTCVQVNLQVSVACNHWRGGGERGGEIHGRRARGSAMWSKKGRGITVGDGQKTEDQTSHVQLYRLIP